MSHEKQINNSISLATAHGEIDGFRTNFRWLDGVTPVSFIIGEEVTKDGLPVVYSTRPAKDDLPKTEYSPEPILQYRHELSPNPKEARVFYILGEEISILDDQGVPVDVTVQLRIEKTASVSAMESVGSIAAIDQFSIAA